jgi:hypothetical protein
VRANYDDYIIVTARMHWDEYADAQYIDSVTSDACMQLYGKLPVYATDADRVRMCIALDADLCDDKHSTLAHARSMGVHAIDSTTLY